MAITLNPPPQQLGILSPALGPWFRSGTSFTGLELVAPQPADKLALRVNAAAAGTDWLPPATGTLSLYVADPANRPPAIAHLQDADGGWPFEAGSLVAWFRLLPEVEARLHDLMRFVPPATAASVGAAPTTPAPAASRARIRSFAVVPTIAALDHDSVVALVGGASSISGAGDNTERMVALGLALEEDGTVTNGAIPMTHLRRVGEFRFDPSLPAEQDAVLTGLSGEFRLWAFDHRGRAVDPGAVAAWWSWLLTDAVGDLPVGSGALQLLAVGIDSIRLDSQAGRRVVCRFAGARTAHLVDAHEGPLGEPLLGAGGRLRRNGAAATSNLLAVTSTAPAPVILDFSPLTPDPARPADNPTVDLVPRGRLAALPDGSYGPSVTLWPSGSPTAPGLERDFVRVAALDEESHLLGVRRRDSRTAATNAEERRASAQNRPSTRTLVSRTASTQPVLLASADRALAALSAVHLSTAAAAAGARAVLGVGDAQAGPVGTGLQASPGTPPPLPTGITNDANLGARTYRVRALAGGGASTTDDQAVLVEISVGAEHAGTWVRAWPLGFDLATGLHFRLTGGGGRVGSSGVARLVMTLANGLLDTRGLLGMDVMASRLNAAGEIEQRGYADQRFERPEPVAGPPGAASGFTAGTTWAVCETGEEGTGQLTGGSVPPGASLVVTSGAVPAVVDRTTVPATALTPGALTNVVQGNHIVSLTEPAFLSAPDRQDALGRPRPRESTTGDPTGDLPGIVHRLARISGFAASSAAFALQDRLEVAAAAAGGAVPQARACIGGVPPLSVGHEQDPHFLGHPGVRAAIEVHGTGVELDGPPAVAVLEYTRERTAGLSFSAVAQPPEPAGSILVQSELAVAAEAATALPTVAAGTDPGPVVAVLRTGVVGQEGIPGIAQAAVTASVFPVGQHAAAVAAWLDDVNAQLQSTPAATQANTLRTQIGAVNESVARALDRRLQVGAFGAREAAVSLRAAFSRAQDLVYIETPAIDGLAPGTTSDDVDLLGALVTRLGQRPGLQVVLCVPALLGPGTPKKLQAVRDMVLMDAIDRLRAAATDRVAVFSPGAGAGRALRYATTSVVVDDVYALTGTTHLWRRGRTFDSSLAAAVFDQRLDDGRPREVLAFRQALLAGQLGLPVSRVPADPAELVRAIREFDEGAGAAPFGARSSQRRAFAQIVKPDTALPAGDIDIWNPDGTRTDLTLPDIVSLFLAAVALTDTEHAILEG